jgi:predicted nucleic acid-binding protein
MSPASPSTVTLVVDASVAIKWLVEEDGSEAAFALRDRDLAAPALLRIEAANVLRTLAARKATTPDEAAALFSLLQAAPVTLVDHDDALEARALQLALALGHPVYDCVYLALAERMGRTLVTADSRFLKALRATPYASRVVALDTAGP